jgi:hypothetical protein
VVAGRRINQLRRDPQVLANPPNAALHDVAYAEFPSDLLDICGLTLVGESRSARDDPQAADARERCDNVLGETVSKKLLFGIDAHVDERQHGNRRFVGKGEDGLRRLTIRSQTVYPHRFRNIFELLLAEVIKSELHLATDMIEDGSRYKDATRIGQGLEPGSDVDPITVKIAALDHHVTEIDADAKDDLSVFRQTAVGRRHGVLQLTSAGDRIDGTCKFDQDPIAHQLDDAPVVLCDQGLKDVSAARLKGGQRS